MSVIDRVKTHFENLRTITIEVDEWKDENGNPSVFYSEPLTLEEKNIIFKKSSNFQDLTVLAGLGLNVLFGWWWADPVAALFLVPFFLKEGMEAFS